MIRVRYVFVGLVMVVFWLAVTRGKINRAVVEQRQISSGFRETTPEELHRQLAPRVPAPYRLLKTPGHHSAGDWDEIIDATWGEGIPKFDQFDLWFAFRTLYNERFMCFDSMLLDDWDAAHNLYYPQILLGASRGQFCAILQHASMILQESHTRAYDTAVFFTELAPGVPLMYVGDWGAGSLFGAGLTPLPDSTVLIYSVSSDHPLGLEPGDRVLGYDGIPWKELFQEILTAQLPMTGYNTGCSPSSRIHRMLMSAGRNCHLFDTVDVIKYVTGDTVHLATLDLFAETFDTYNTEQMPIPGIPKPDLSAGQLATWGIVNGTSIGYIYCYGWGWNVETEFYNAIDSLMNVHETTGLIIDYRLNYGGNSGLSAAGLQLLFKDTVFIYRWHTRCNTFDRLARCRSSSTDYPAFIGDPDTYYDRPIAVLVGPGAISAGDQNALRLAYHPRAKFFGKPTDGAFNSPVGALLHSELSVRYAIADIALIRDTNTMLTRTTFPSTEDYPDVPYQEVWLTPEGVAAGRDDVVDSAVAWILREDVDQDGYPNDIDNCPDDPNPGQENIDGDAWGDVCDDDDDNDGIPDALDNCQFVENPGQEDFDGDSLGNVCDPCDCTQFCDLDTSMVINPIDVVIIVNHVYKDLDSRALITETVCPGDQGDWDCNGNPNPVDVVWYINYVYKGSGIGPCDPCACSPYPTNCPGYPSD